jgi:hypothetical protein
MEKGEVWKTIQGWEQYEISSFGRVKSFKGRKDRILKSWSFSDGYSQVTLCNRGFNTGKSIHRLVAEAFIPNPENKPQVNHINGIKTDNRVENLEWVTPEENMIHAYLAGLIKEGSKHYNSKLNDEQVSKMRNLYRTGNYSQRDLAKKFGTTQANVSNVISGKTWKRTTQ